MAPRFSLTWVQVTHAVICLLSILLAGLWLPELLFPVRLPASICVILVMLYLLLLLSQAGRDVLHSFPLALLI